VAVRDTFEALFPTGRDGGEVAEELDTITPETRRTIVASTGTFDRAKRLLSA